MGGSWEVWGEAGKFGGKLGSLGGSWEVWGEASPLPPPHPLDRTLPIGLLNLEYSVVVGDYLRVAFKKVGAGVWEESIRGRHLFDVRRLIEEIRYVIFKTDYVKIQQVVPKLNLLLTRKSGFQSSL